MKIFNSLNPIWRKKLLPKIQISMCREVVSTLSYILFSGEEIPTQTKKRQRHQGINHVDPLAPGTAWEASWCSVGTTTPLFSSSECNWTARGVILQPPDSQYWKINSWLKTLERTLSQLETVQLERAPSPVWTLLNGNQWSEGSRNNLIFLTCSTGLLDLTPSIGSCLTMERSPKLN